MSKTLDLTGLARRELAPYIAHIRGFIGELVVRSLLENYIAGLEERGACVVARTEFCARSVEEAIADLIGLPASLSYGAALAKRGELRFEGVWLSQGALLPQGISVTERETPGGTIYCIEVRGNAERLIGSLARRLATCDPALVRDFTARLTCSVELHVFEKLVQELACLSRCFKGRAGKSCFDFLVVSVEHGDVRGLLVEVKTDKSDAEALRRAVLPCKRECEAELVDVSVVYVDVNLGPTRVCCSVYGDTSWI